MKKNLGALLWVAAVLGGCAVTRIHTISSNLAPGTSYQKIIVHANLADPAAQKIVEDAVVRQFQGIGVTVTASYTLFPPGNSDTLDRKKEIIQAHGFDAGLLVQVTNVFSKTDDPIFFNQSEVDMTTAHFKILTKLVEAKGFTVVWQAQTGSREDIDDSGNFSVKDLMASYAGALVGEMQKEGIVKASMNLDTLFR